MRAMSVLLPVRTGPYHADVYVAVGSFGNIAVQIKRSAHSKRSFLLASALVPSDMRGCLRVCYRQKGKIGNEISLKYALY